MADTPNEHHLEFSLETNGIEAKALIYILQDTQLAFREIARASGLVETELKIYPFKQGSFEYVLALAAGGLSLATAGVTAYREIIAYKRSLLELDKTRLELEKLEKKDTQTQKAETNGKILIENNPTINVYIDGMLKTISNNTDGFSVKEPGKPALKLTSKEIKRIREIERSLKKETAIRKRTIDEPNVLVTLVEVSNKKYGMWEFIYNGVKIMAKVPGDLKKAANFTKYQPGTQMRVFLSIRQEFNKLANEWENIGYTISMVHQIEKPSRNRV